mgnify:CR=1 FL=1
MIQREITVLTDIALITCVVQRGLADIIIQAAREAGAQGATVYFARGMGIRERLGILGVSVEVEKEIIEIVVSKDQVERIFERMYLAATSILPEWGLCTSPLSKKPLPLFPQKSLQNFLQIKNPKNQKKLNLLLTNQHGTRHI